MILLYGYILYWILAAIGITWGYHRYFAHGGKQQHPVLEIIYLYFGLLCGGRSLLTWAGVHRMHHAYADTDNDPHSPKNHPWYVVLFSLWKVKSIPRKFLNDLILDLGLSTGSDIDRDKLEIKLDWGGTYKPSETEIKQRVTQLQKEIKKLTRMIEK